MTASKNRDQREMVICQESRLKKFTNFERGAVVPVTQKARKKITTARSQMAVFVAVKRLSLSKVNAKSANDTLVNNASRRYVSGSAFSDEGLKASRFH